MSTFLSFAVLLAVMAVTPGLAYPNFGNPMSAAGGAAPDAGAGAAQARALGMGMGAAGMGGAGMGAYGVMPGAGYGAGAFGASGLTADQFGRASFGGAQAYNPSAAMHAQRLGQMGMGADMGAAGMGAGSAAYGMFGPAARSAAGAGAMGQAGHHQH